MKPVSQTVNRGSVVTVQVVVQSVPSLGAYQLTLSYDSSILTALSIADGWFLRSTGRDVSCPPPVFEPGAVTFGCYTKGTSPTGPSGSGVLATVTFAASCGSGTSPLDLTQIELASPLGAGIPLQRVDGGSVTLNEAEPCPVPSPDSDLDGCADAREQGSNPVQGGQRNSQDFWDFFDTPPRDRAVTIGDIGRIVARFGTYGGGATSIVDALAAPPAAPAYHAGFDRMPSTLSGQPWRTNAPNGSITIQDITIAIQSFGHSCV